MSFKNCAQYPQIFYGDESINFEKIMKNLGSSIR